jgi:ABC-type enterochelin transport system substrate-binding protein
MSTGLTEDDMRRALGLDVPSSATPAAPAEPEPLFEPAPEKVAEPEPEPVVIAAPAPKPKAKTKRLSPALVVTLRVTKEFEGEETLYVHEAKTLSTFDAEQEARKAAAKEKYKYFEVVSIKRVE